MDAEERVGWMLTDILEAIESSFLVARFQPGSHMEQYLQRGIRVVARSTLHDVWWER